MFARGGAEPKASETPGTNDNNERSPRGATDRIAKILPPLRGFVFSAPRPGVTLRSTPG
jgi:hypothetical protein